MECDTALRPQVESSHGTYRGFQAYISVHAQDEFYRLKKMNADELSADFVYKVVGAEFGKSSSASEFEQRMNKRLDEENFTMSKEESRTYYRQFLIPEQLTAWTECIRIKTAAQGGILISAQSPSPAGFPIKIQWIPQAGATSGVLVVDLLGGTIDGEASVSKELKGPSTFVSNLKPDPGAAKVSVTATVGPLAEVASIDLAPQPQTRRASISIILQCGLLNEPNARLVQPTGTLLEFAPDFVVNRINRVFPIEVWGNIEALPQFPTLNPRLSDDQKTIILEAKSSENQGTIGIRLPFEYQ